MFGFFLLFHIFEYARHNKAVSRDFSIAVSKNLKIHSIMLAEAICCIVVNTVVGGQQVYSCVVDIGTLAAATVVKLLTSTMNFS